MLPVRCSTANPSASGTSPAPSASVSLQPPHSSGSELDSVDHFARSVRHRVGALFQTSGRPVNNPLGKILPLSRKCCDNLSQRPETVTDETRRFTRRVRGAQTFPAMIYIPMNFPTNRTARPQMPSPTKFRVLTAAIRFMRKRSSARTAASGSSDRVSREVLSGACWPCSCFSRFCCHSSFDALHR